MNRENYLHDYPVDSVGYPHRNNSPYKSVTPLESSMGILPPQNPSVYPYQGPISNYPFYQPTVPPTYEPQNYEQKGMSGYDDQAIYWRGF